ncbi:MAG TPA: DUF5000 domain-containing lipoprotein [Sphingobacterium sp.]|nr:DUF5000 domain-containing lipoprotein [Sphingobacterium sp.]
MNTFKLMLRPIVLIMGMMSLLHGCSEREIDLSPYKTRYTMIPEELELLPGYNRVKVRAIVSDPEITELRVFWNNMADSVVIPVPNVSETVPVTAVLENLPEGTLRLRALTFDKNNVSSRNLDFTVEVYGAGFASAKTNRAVAQGVTTSNEVRIEWAGGADAADVGVYIRYKDLAGTEYERWVPAGTGMTRIEGKVLDDVLQYKTAFLPPNGIDTLFMDYETIHLVPPAPVMLDKGKFVAMALPTDIGPSAHSDGIAGMWDGKSDNTRTGFWGTATVDKPHWFTFDMGVTASLDRIVYHQRPGTTASPLYYDNANARVWEMWGSNNPNPDGSWDGSWVKLMDCVSIKPSGLPRGQLSPEDIEYASVGETFSFSAPTVPVRYIRIKVIDTWNPTLRNSIFGEMTFYGVAE